MHKTGRGSFPPACVFRNMAGALARRQLQFPAFAVFAPYDVRGLGSILGEHFRAVPFEFPAHAQRHTAQQDDLSEISRDIEARVARFAALGRGDPFWISADRIPC